MKENRYKVNRWGMWWWGILDTQTKCGNPLMLVKENKGEVKLVLFKTKEEAQEIVDKLNGGKLNVKEEGWETLE